MIESELRTKEQAYECNTLKKERKMIKNHILHRARSFQALVPDKSEGLLPIVSINGESQSLDKTEKLNREI